MLTKKICQAMGESRFKYFEAPDKYMHHGRRTLLSTLSFPVGILSLMR
jgi:hypothetical protein